ncbi:MAG: ion channel [Pseudomonadota bacterium]
MTIWKQIALGSSLLACCVVSHVAILGAGIELFAALGLSDGEGAGSGRWISLILAASGVVLAGHTAQVWIWALAFRFLGALNDLGEAIYFALVTTTTLGYGDVTLRREHRVFGAMSAVTGLMTYGLSTAFLIGVAEGVLRQAS